MQYDDMTKQVMKLDFIQDRDTADAALKAVWGVIASAVDENTAREFTRGLPDPLTEEKLRSHQARPTDTPALDLVDLIGNQFHLSSEQSRELIQWVIETGEQAMPEESVERIRDALPDDMKSLV